LLAAWVCGDEQPENSCSTNCQASSLWTNAIHHDQMVVWSLVPQALSGWSWALGQARKEQRGTEHSSIDMESLPAKGSPLSGSWLEMFLYMTTRVTASYRSCTPQPYADDNYTPST
jgi:hypothetical protein